MEFPAASGQGVFAELDDEARFPIVLAVATSSLSGLPGYSLADRAAPHVFCTQS